MDDDRELPDGDDEVEAGSDTPEGDEDAELGDEGDGEDDVPAGDEAEPEGGEAPDEVDEEPRRRGQTPNERIREAKRAQKEADRKAAETERKLADIEARAAAAERRAEAAERVAQERRQAETAEQEAARLELMSESEKIAHYRQKDKTEFEHRLNGIQFQQWDSTDRMEFRQLARDNPLVAKVKEKVEAEYEALRRQGKTVSREILAKLELGKMTLDGYKPAAERQRKRAADAVRRETVRAPRTRSDVAGDRQRRGEVDEKAARRKRLEGVEL